MVVFGIKSIQTGLIFENAENSKQLSLGKRIYDHAYTTETTSCTCLRVHLELNNKKGFYKQQSHSKLHLFGKVTSVPLIFAQKLSKLENWTNSFQPTKLLQVWKMKQKKHSLPCWQISTIAEHLISRRFLILKQSAERFSKYMSSTGNNFEVFKFETWTKNMKNKNFKKSTRKTKKWILATNLPAFQNRFQILPVQKTWKKNQKQLLTRKTFLTPVSHLLRSPAGLPGMSMGFQDSAHSLFASSLQAVWLPHTEHTFSAFWLWSSVVSVLISVTTDMSPTGDLLVTSIFAGEVSSWARSEAFTCCAGMAPSQWQHTLLG